MEFAKMHGLGNDFLIVKTSEDRGAGALGSLAERMCHRRLGVGADGVLFYTPLREDDGADVSALIFNSDGSPAEMSGNGTRCLAAYLIHSGSIHASAVRIRTVCGDRIFDLLDRAGTNYTFLSSLGQPVTEPARVPVLLGSGSGPLVGYPVDAGGVVVRITTCSLGNPHCCTFWPDVDQAPVETLGPALERHSCFPNRANVEFIQVRDRHRLKVRFYERGVGPTLASGTGSAAAVVAAFLNGLVENPVTVEVELGELLVDWKPPAALRLRGPAEFVCSGTFPD